MPGPDPQFTAEEVRQAIRQSSGVVAQAARILDCSPALIYKYADKYVTVQTTLEEARLNHAAKAEAYHARLVEDREHADHYNALMDVLRNYHPDDWSDKKTEQEHSGDRIGDINLNVVHTDADQFEQERREAPESLDDRGDGDPPRLQGPDE